ncbi:related to Endo-1,3(4)-beta-glucanase 2 [Zygosaccharomyces bailii ISA1307]|nr:related to Endo-1,3(4)-beta-glucanase 2 [Zygosaccharomyces bailii ISA1307]
MAYKRPPMPIPGGDSSNPPPIPPRDFEDNPPPYEEVVGKEGGIPPPIPARNFGNSPTLHVPPRPPGLPTRPSSSNGAPSSSFSRSGRFLPLFKRPPGPPPQLSRPQGPPPQFSRPQGPPPQFSRPQGPPPQFNRPHGPPPIPTRPEFPSPSASEPANSPSGYGGSKKSSSASLRSEALPPATLDTGSMSSRPSTKPPIAVEGVEKQFSKLDVIGTLDFDTILRMEPPGETFAKVTHEVPIPLGVDNKGRPIETNKFYGNMLVGSQKNAVWTHPYSLWWSKDIPFLGVAISHCTADQRVLGPDDGPKQFMFNPIGIKSFVFSSPQFSSEDDMTLGLSELKHMSAQILLKKNEEQFIQFPLVQGMGFVTAIYNNMVPKLLSAVVFRDFKQVRGSSNIQKYAITLENGITWSLYVTGPPIQLNLVDLNTIIGSQIVSKSVFQLVADFKEEIDYAAGCYPVDCQLACSTGGNIGQYSFNYKVAGNSSSGSTLMYALPHHDISFTESMMTRKTTSRLDSTVCGVMTGYITNTFEMRVELPEQLGFEPFTTIPGAPPRPNYSPQVLDTIKQAASKETNGDVLNESNLDSMYFSGKALAKYAWILYCCHSIIKDRALVAKLMPKLKEAMARFVNNSQILPLNYDNTWGGIISSGTSSQDFGNSYYNDHHFHYSYHVITAAILAIVDREAGDNKWMSENKQWVETLIRDYANPSEKDQYFPVFRSFDWFNGHSWAKGLFESGDGKDQESSSEDVNASYSLKLWGLATENTGLVNLGNMQLGILKTSLNLYFLYTDDNNIIPPEIVTNKVSGIMFENKIDHTTYFGNKLQYIQMIHAIPITPASSFVRSARFVREEWDEKLRAIMNDVDDGWKGIIMLNVALCDPNMSYAFFSSSTFSPKWLDGGQSWTWSLAYPGAFLK